MIEYLSVFRSCSGENIALEAYDNLLTNWTVPFNDIYLDTMLGSTHIIASGQSVATPLFLVHAFYSSAVSWYQNVEFLSKNYRVYAIDIIGDPNKSKPFKPIRKSLDYVEWFKEIMDLLNIESADFIGNSVGAFHVANFALNEPDRVRSITLIGPAATFINIPKFYVHTFPGGMTGWSFLVTHAIHWIENGIHFEPQFYKLFFLLLKHGKSANQVFPSVLTDKQLKQIKTPTLLIYGEKEVICDYKSAIRRAEKNLMNIKIEIIPRANHITGATNPDLTNSAILKFLSFR